MIGFVSQLSTLLGRPVSAGSSSSFVCTTMKRPQLTSFSSRITASSRPFKSFSSRNIKPPEEFKERPITRILRDPLSLYQPSKNKSRAPTARSYGSTVSLRDHPSRQKDYLSVF